MASTLAAIGMAVGPPLIYADQAYSIISKNHRQNKSAPHTSQQTEGEQDEHLELEAHLQAERWQIPNVSGTKGLIQRFKEGRRPWDFWMWEGYGAYLEFLAGMIIVLGVAQISFGRWSWYVDALGFVALTIESTLPIPQFVTNFKNKSCYGFRSSTLAGWFFGDCFKTGYFFFRHSPIQFKVTAIMLVCWDFAVLVQRIIYGAKPPAILRIVEFDAEGDQTDTSRLRYDDSEHT
nr:hypothetical protein L204_06075 [Cryptococcus depauperatus CBS 7855]